MDRALVHFELFVRPRRRAPWSLALATEDRGAAFEAAQAALAATRGAAVRLCKETHDPASGEYRPLVLLERGETAEPPVRLRSKGSIAHRATAGVRTSCAQPRDLYATPARETIGKVLAGWLGRNRVTPFELLHRADLAERLEACEAELSAALYNAALAEAAARGVALEPVRRGLDDLVRRAIERILSDDPDIAFRLGVAVAARLGRHPHWKDKLEVLLELFEAAPDEGQPAQVSLRVLQQPLIDILGAQGDLGEIFGAELPPGERLMLLMQIASAPALALAAAGEGDLARLVPRLKGLAARLALILHGRPVFVRARRAIVRRVLAALGSGERLWPDNPAREVEGTQALAELLAVSGRLVDQDEVVRALAGRWRRMSAPDFIEDRLAACHGAVEEADVLLGLAGCAIGRDPIEAFGRRLVCLVAERAFEQEARFNPDPAQVSLARLAGLIARVRASALRPDARTETVQRLRRLAAAIEADAAAYAA